jgi:hypothetical protein
VYGRDDLIWDGGELQLNRGRVLATVVPDEIWPGMWRARLPDGHLADMVNLSRAKDAAVSLALAALNSNGSSTTLVRKVHLSGAVGALSTRKGKRSEMMTGEPGGPKLTAQYHEHKGQFVDDLRQAKAVRNA